MRLFHTLDPAPFHDKDLDDDAAEHLEQACDEAGHRRSVRLVVHLPAEEAEGVSVQTLPEAIHNFFGYWDLQLSKDIARVLPQGAASLVIGLAFLVACLVIRRTFDAHPIFVDQSVIDEDC